MMHPRVEDLKRDLIALMIATIVANRGTDPSAAGEALQSLIEAALLSAEVRS